MSKSNEMKPGKNGYKIVFANNTIVMNYKFAADIPANEVINNSNPESLEIYLPKVKEVVIKRPIAEGRDRPKPVQEPTKQEFTF